MLRRAIDRRRRRRRRRWGLFSLVRRRLGSQPRWSLQVRETFEMLSGRRGVEFREENEAALVWKGAR